MVQGHVPTVFVSGASSDIGLSVCRRYLDAGWKVIGHYRTWRPELDAFQSKAIEMWQADFAETGILEAKLRNDVAFFQRADAFVNLAAAFEPRSFQEASAADMMQTLAVNLI